MAKTIEQAEKRYEAVLGWIAPVEPGRHFECTTSHHKPSTMSDFVWCAKM
jgi:hypothetical protein